MSFNREEMIEKIRELLETKELSEIEKANYSQHLENILFRLQIIKDNDEIRIENQNILNLFDRLNSKPDKKKNNNDVPNETKKEQVEGKIHDFMKDCNNLEKMLNVVQKSLILSTDIDLGISDAIRGLDTELEGLSNQVKELKNDIDEFRSLYNTADFSMSVVEMQKILKSFRTRIKNIKLIQVHQYNARVMATNKRIAELKAMTGLNEETLALINDLEELEFCALKGISYGSSKYLNVIDNYNKLIETNQKISEIEKRVGLDRPEDNSYDTELTYIENILNEINAKINDKMSLDEANSLKSDMEQLANRINDLNARILNELSEEKREEYLTKLKELKSRLEELTLKVESIINNINNNDYKMLSEKLNGIIGQIDYFDNVISSVYANISDKVVMQFRQELDALSAKLDDIEKEIIEKHNKGKLDDVQFENLNNKLKEAREKLETTKGKLKDPGLIKDNDVFEFLNGQIDGLTAAIDALEGQIDSLEKPIKDKNTRKTIDREFERLENEIKYIRHYLELHKDDDEENYNKTSERLNEQEKRLDDLAKKYRKKCPFLVKTVKSAKDFYKKHKKVCLIAAGLAAMALIHATIGPIIIPAIMHGNLMIMHSAPALRGTFMAINNVLGKAIHAQVINNIWTLANGVRIAPYCASASLLKGIAISGMGTAAIVTPLVVGVKKLINKMNLAELKQKASEGFKKGKEKAQDAKKKLGERANNAKEKVKEKVKKRREPTDTSNYQMEEYMSELYRQYIESGLTLDEFCIQNGIPDEAKEFIMLVGEKKAGGRRGR